jgi:hypothetical protein
MGNNIYNICGGKNSKKLEDNEFPMTKTPNEMTITPEAVKSVEKIQTKFRASKAKGELSNSKSYLLKEFDENIANYGQYITISEMNGKTDENVRKVETILKPLKITDEERNRYKHVFEKPPILFKDGTIYKGQWNYLGKKHGYGIYIKKDGSKYEGFWLNDKIHGKGRYIEKRGNYYEGLINY